MTITDRGRNTHVARLFHEIIIFPHRPALRKRPWRVDPCRNRVAGGASFWFAIMHAIACAFARRWRPPGIFRTRHAGAVARMRVSARTTPKI
jgi:hypothetical protein